MNTIENLKNLSFSKVLEFLKAWEKARRKDWNKDTYIKVQYPTEKSKMNQPYFYCYCEWNLAPTFLDSDDLLAEDWEIIIDKKEFTKEEMIKDLLKEVPEKHKEEVKKIIELFLENSNLNLKDLHIIIKTWIKRTNKDFNQK